MTLQISNLSKRYGNNWVLRDVSFTVEKGNVLGVIGPAASGKSTLIRILARREKASSDSAGVSSEGRHLALCEASPASKSFWRVGRSNEDPRTALNALQRSLDRSEDLLLLDDPLRGFERETRDKYLAQVKKLAIDRHLTVVYATSDFEAAALVSDRIAVLGDGYIQQTGTAEQLYEQPITTIVARSTGRCNIFSARRLTSTKYEVPEFQTIDGGHRLFAERSDISKLGAITRDVSLAIRPENISMSFGSSFPEDNILKAVVTGVKFLGPVTVVELDANGLLLNTLVFRLVGLDVNQECMLGLPPDRIKVLKD